MTDRELMQQALDLLDDINQCSLPPTGIPLPAEIDHVMEALRARLAQPEPEPINYEDWNYNPMTGEPLWGKQPEQEPQEAIAKWIKANTEHKEWYICPKCRHQTPRFKNEWQGLTDEEIMNLIHDVRWQNMVVTTDYLARAIEAKLKEKNT